ARVQEPGGVRRVDNSVCNRDRTEVRRVAVGRVPAVAAARRQRPDAARLGGRTVDAVLVERRRADDAADTRRPRSDRGRPQWLEGRPVEPPIEARLLAFAYDEA